MVVVIKCRKCGQEFPSKLVQAVSEERLRCSHFKKNNEACSSCGQSSSYSINDYFWKI